MAAATPRQGWTPKGERPAKRGFPEADSPAPKGDAHPLVLANGPHYIEQMCNDYEQDVRWAEYCAVMQALELGIPTQQTELDLPQDLGPVMRAAGNGIELFPMNFSFSPPGPRGGPVFNFRSEGRHFDKSNRCLIPTSAFFEFTGKKYPKAKHRFALKGSPVTAIAAGARAKEIRGRHLRC
jgi:putative SOS response-associated peptidase YedK